jgi:hypothetical protein
MSTNTLNSAAPWWKFGHVWLVVAGPAVVVVASFITLYLAVTRPDPVVTEDYYRKGLDINKGMDEAQIAKAVAAAGNLAPAGLARNHAATGVVVPPSAIAKP